VATITIRLDDSDRKAIEEFAARRGMTLSQWLRRLISRGLDSERAKT
jgi:predicted DNA binding CopG/RHH family protein